MSKFLKAILLLSFLFIVGCINDLSFYHDSISESKENGLLISEYKSDKQYIEVANGKYEIIEAWTAYKFKSRDSKEIYKKIIAFTVILEDKNKSRDPEVRLMDFIKCENKDALFNGIGIDDSQYRVFFDKKSFQYIDTIKFEIMSSKDVYNSLIFTKK